MKKTMIRRLASGILALCSAVLVAFGVCSLNASAETTKYAYTLAFQDNFDGTLSDGWAVIKGGSSYSYETDTGIKYGWRFRGNDHIAYKTATATDYGKFLYGDLSFTDYVFEVKMRADVNETLGEFLTEYSANLGAGLSLNTHLPFFVTDSSPDAAKYTFIGRSVCVSNYAIGFYEYGGDNGNGWAKSVRLNTKFSGDFDWRQWHTVRVEASAAVCNVYLDDVLMVSAAQSDFTRATATSGFCGFAGVCSAAYSPLHFDDFRLWEKNAAYDPEEREEKEITAMNAADFKDKTKTDYQSASVNTALMETEKNALIYNTDGAFGTDIRLLKDTTFQSFEITAAFGIENQKAAKGVVEGEALSSDVRTGIGGILFYGSDHNTADGTVLYSGYMLRYHAVYCSGGNVNNTILLEIRKYENNVTPQAAEAQIGVLRGTTSCIINAKAENGIISVSVYKTAEDLANGNKAALDSSSSSVTAENGVYSFALPDYNAETGGDYTEGQIGFWCNGGGTGTRYVYEAEILSFRGKATVPSDAPLYQPVEEEAEYTLNIAAATGGAVKVNGEEKTGKITAAAHSDVKLSFVPAEGYLIDNVTVNGVFLGGAETFFIGNITKNYEVEVTFTNVKIVDVYILAGQSNAAGFTPLSGLYKPYTYGGKINESKLAEYENGYTDVLYYGVTQTNDPASSGAEWSYVTAGEGATADRIGAELGFGEIMSGYYGGVNGKAAFIKYAVGSTGFQYRSASDGVSGIVNTFGNWISPTSAAKMQAAGETLHPKTGLMYQNLLLTVTQAVDSLIAKGYLPEIKGIMWMQGCEDASWEDLAYSYKEHLSDLIADLRADLTTIMQNRSFAQDCSSLPFVIGKIGADLQKAQFEDVVREQMQMTAASMQNVRIVETEDFMLPDVNDNNDVWHFSAKDVLALGNRFAHILLQETGKEETVFYDVSFSANGETGVQSVKQWMTAAEPEAPLRRGYIFTGWFAENSVTAWNFSADSVGKNVVLTAGWVPETYTVVYRLNDGEFVDVNVKVSYTVEDGEYVLPVPVRTGYAFAGWYENAEFTGEPVTAIAAASVGEKEYFAKWSKEAVYVSVTVVQAEHGAISVNTGAQSETGVKVTVTAVPEEGYKLTAITVNGVLLEGNEFVLAQDVVITAEFSRNELMYAVSVQQCEHGVIVTDKKYAFENEIVTVTVTPESGYKLKAVYVNGQQIDGNSFVAQKECIVTAEFEADTENSKSGGCKASASVGVLPVLLCAAGFLKKRRKKN